MYRERDTIYRYGYTRNVYTYTDTGSPSVCFDPEILAQVDKTIIIPPLMIINIIVIIVMIIILLLNDKK